MSSVQDATKPVKTIPFSGKKSDFFLWSARFLAYCQIQGCKNILLGKETILNTAAFKKIEEDDPTFTKELAIQNKNELAIILLTMAVSDAISYAAIHNACTIDYENGNAAQAWKNLNGVFKPLSSAQKHELEQEFNKCALLHEETNPDEWFADLEKIRLQIRVDFDETLDDGKVISHILYNVRPKLYDTIITVMKRDLNRNSSSMTLEQVKEELRQQYGNFRATSKTSHSRSTGETILIAKSNFKKQIKTDCRICGKKGHKAINCWNNPKNSKAPTAKLNNSRSDATMIGAENSSNKRHCTYCNKTGHTVDHCWTKMKNERNKAGNHDTANVHFALVHIETADLYESKKTETDLKSSSISLISGSKHKITKNTFIADTGATCHMRSSLLGMYDLKPFINEVKVGNSSVMKSVSKGKFLGLVTQQDGTTIEIIMENVLYVPDLWINLFSLTIPLENPMVSLSGQNGHLALHFGRDQIVFDQKIKNGSGTIYGVEIIPITKENTNLSVTQVKYSVMHEILGHANSDVVKATALKYKLKFTGSPHTCINCALSKQRQKNVSKITHNHATEIGQRISIDISSVMVTSFGQNKYWLLIQDEFSDHVWSYFLKAKSELPDTVLKWIYSFHKNTKYTIKSFRLDNAGENKAFKNLIDTIPDLNIKFEFTAPNTPQHNGKVERKFATLYGKVRSMLNSARLSTCLRHGLWAQCAKLATQLENIIVTTPNDQSACEKVFGTNPAWINHMHIFGEVAMVAYRNKIKGKLADRGLPVLFIGYSENHSPDVYQFYKLETRATIESRDVIWINKNYTEYMELVGKTVTSPSENLLPVNDSDTEEGESYQDEVLIPTHENTTNQNRQAARIPKIARELRGLQDFNLPPRHDSKYDSNESEDESNNSNELNDEPYTDVVALAHQNHSHDLHVMLDDGQNIPKMYLDAKNGDDWKNWWNAVKTELHNMEEKDVWDIVPRSELPSGRKLIGNRWVFTRKDDGRYRARTVAKGFSQIPGKDFHENFAPVVNDVSLRIVLILMKLFHLQTGQFDVETAFLYGDLDEELWMVLPDGYQEYVRESYAIEISPAVHCLRLRKAIYGLVQAARQWWKKFKNALEKLKYYASKVDPCLFIKNENDKLSFVIVYVDDGGVIGTDSEIKILIDGLNETFKIKFLGNMEHFVGCHIIEREDLLLIHQPRLLMNSRKHFKDLIESEKHFKTPAAPKNVIMRPLEGDP